MRALPEKSYNVDGVVHKIRKGRPVVRNPGIPTFDQLIVFVAVVETGSLAAAGRRLGRATSAISYAVDNLEAQLGLALFDRSGTRKPRLTKAGQAVLAEARSVSHGVDALRAKAKGLLDGLEAEVSLAVDVMLPTARLVDALQAFQSEFPTVALRLHVEALGAVTQLVLEGKASIGVNSPLHGPVEGLERILIGGVEMIPVAAPMHPLTRQENPPGAPNDYTQLVLSDRSARTEGKDFAVVSNKTWRLADLGAKRALLLAGVGWGNMPEFMIRDDLAAGRLIPLKLPEWQGGTYSLQVVYRASVPPGPAAQWLIDRLIDQSVRD